MKRAATVLVLLGSGCRFDPHLATAGDASSDGSLVADVPAGSVDAAPDAACDWAIHFDSCATSDPPPGGIVLTTLVTWTFDTDAKQFSPVLPAGNTFVAATITQPTGGSAVLIATQSFDVQPGATLIVIGSNPLIIGSWTTVTVNGVIDAGSHRGVITGAGASTASCAANAATAGGNSNAGGGGGGGGFRGAGGNGAALSGATPGNSGDGGAGGGGCAGFILIHAPSFSNAGATLSPAAQSQ
jgi:hypothetical protein